jgi:hypothetical protein
LLALLLSGCHPAPWATPDINDRSAPYLRLVVFYDASHSDVVVSQIYSSFPNRCLYVSNPFRVFASAADFEGGISYLNLSSPDLLPIANSIAAGPPPGSPTQTFPQTSPPVTYPNPGMLPGSHTVEVTYYTGASPAARLSTEVTLEADYDFGGKTVADISATARNTSVSASTSSIDGYFVRPADAAHAPGSACTPPP